MSAKPEHVKIAQRPTFALVEILREFLPPRPHEDECGLGSCAPHVALDALAVRAEQNQDTDPAKSP